MFLSLYDLSSVYPFSMCLYAGVFSSCILPTSFSRLRSSRLCPLLCTYISVRPLVCGLSSAFSSLERYLVCKCKVCSRLCSSVHVIVSVFLCLRSLGYVSFRFLSVTILLFSVNCVISSLFFTSCWVLSTMPSCM